MPSLTVTGAQYLQNALAVESQGPFTHRLLAEGDSWMDKSAPLMGALPHFLVRELNRRGQSVLIINIASAGHTLRRITDTMAGEFAWWLGQFAYDGILFSAGGNDFIHAALDPAAGQGLLRNMAGQAPPPQGYDCVRPSALQRLVQHYLQPNFATIYQAIRRSPLNGATPIFLNSYDTPTARAAPAAPGFGPWLSAAYRKNHIAPHLWPGLTAGLFRDIEQTVHGWCHARTRVYAVPTTGLLTPAPPGSTGSRGDWVDEIHPNASGWRKLSRVWAQSLLNQL